MQPRQQGRHDKRHKKLFERGMMFEIPDHGRVVIATGKAGPADRLLGFIVAAPLHHIVQANALYLIRGMFNNILENQSGA